MESKMTTSDAAYADQVDKINAETQARNGVAGQCAEPAPLAAR